VKIRIASDADRSAIIAIHADAFGHDEGPVVADLTAALLDDPTAQPLLSLVAECEGMAAGHVLFTTAHIEPAARGLSARILAPLAVVTKCQGRGVGGALIREGLNSLAACGVDLVFVLGHPGYYTQHSFAPAGVLGYQAPYPIEPRNADAWMVQALREGVIGSGGGVVRCAASLDQPQYWCE
jgi:predicted N-acetyltransferase YhbS